MNFSLIYPGERKRLVLLMVAAVTLWVILLVATFGLILVYLLFIALLALFVHSAFIAMIRGNAVCISDEQYPELAADIRACCERVGVERVPAAYLLHADGMFNALATRFLRRHYIVLFSSVVDALDDRPDAVRFYIGHELGHIRQHHLRWGAVLAIASWLPLLGAAYRRACEYTCDRYGLACCPDPNDAFAALSALAAGESRWSSLDLTVYAEQRHDVRGFWASLHELCGDYPWTAKRAHAILRLADGEEPSQPSRNGLAFVIAALTPRIPGFGGAGIILTLAIIVFVIPVAVVAYGEHRTSAHLATFFHQTGTDEAAVTDYVMQEEAWPSSLEEVDVAPRRSGGQLAADVALGDQGELIYTFSGGRFDQQSLLLVPSPRFDEQQSLVGLEWSCMSNDVAQSVLPDGCQHVSP